MRREMRTAIILARDDRGLLTAFGVPLVRRLAILASRMGIERIFVIGKIDSLISILSDLVPPGDFHSLGSGDLLEDVIERLDINGEDSILAMRADYLADNDSVAFFLEKADGPGISFMKAEHGGNMDGFYLTSSSDLAPVLQSLWVGGDFKNPVLSRARRVPSPNGLPYIPQNGMEGSAASEERLITALAAHVYPDDGLMARHFDRRISRFISRRLARTDLAPNQITLIGMSIGLLGAFCLSLAGYGIQLFGSLLFVLCVIVDGVDGEVARLKLKESVFGHYLDIITDNIVHVAVFVGIAFGLYHNTGNTRYINLLWVMLGGLGLCMLAVYQCVLRLSEEQLNTSPNSVRFMALLSNRDFAYLIAILAIVDRLNWFLIGSTLGSYVFAIALWVISYRERRRAPG
jgi:phosphatidylglycerophosphate synthase